MNDAGVTQRLFQPGPNDLRFCCGGVPKPPQTSFNKHTSRRLRRARPGSRKRWLGCSHTFLGAD